MIKSAFASIRTFARENPIGFPILLLLLALVTYGIFIKSLGFYWDDWPPLVVSHFADKSSFLQYFSYDRPFQSWTYYLLAPICRDSAFAWQLSVILFRWTTALALYFTFLQIFPKQKLLIQWTAVLFVVFPGFSDQYASVAFGSHFLTYTVYGLSLLTITLAIKRKKQFWIFFPLSLILTAIHLFTMEYFVGLELLRPVLLYLLLAEPGNTKARTLTRTIKFWLPYAVVLGIYLYWRMVLYQAAMGGVTSDNYPYVFQDLLKSPLPTLVKLLETIFTDLRFLFISSWTDRLFPADFSFERITFWASLLIGLVTAGFVYFLNFYANKESDEKLESRINSSLVVLGIWIVLVGMFPLWSTLRQVTAGKWSGRFDIPAMWGVAMIIAAIALAAIQNRKVQGVLFIVIVGLSIGYQIRVANDYRKDFQRQERFYTELKWRIPSLEPGTALYSPTIPASKEADYSFSTGINLMYSDNAVGDSTNYWMSGPRYYDVNELVAYPSIQIKADMRTFHFSSTADKVVSIYMPPTGCLWVVDPYSALMLTNIDKFTSYGKLTNQNLIQSTDNGVNGLATIFNFNQNNSWCYYFEQGDLAQSKGQWEQAISLFEQAMAMHLVPLERIEYLPFIRAYAASGNMDQAVHLTNLANNDPYKTKPVFCQFWQDTLVENQALDPAIITSVYNADLCPSFFPSGKQ